MIEPATVHPATSEPAPLTAPASAAPPPAAAPGPPDDVTSPLTGGQMLFWFAHQLNPDVQLYFATATTLFTLEGAIDPRHFRRAFAQLIASCDSLRSTFRVVGGEPRRAVAPRVAAQLAVVDLAALPDPAAACRTWVRQRAAVRLDLAVRLFDSALLRLAPRRWAWYWNVHHIVADAWSIARIAEILSRYYRLSLAGELAGQPALPSFRSYVEHEERLRRSPRYERARRYWEEKLAAPLPRAAFYRRAAGDNGQRTARVTVELGDRDSAAIAATVARGELFSPAVVFATVTFALLHRLTGERTLRLGTPFANRGAEWAELIGLQMNACPLQITLDTGETFLSLARKVQRETVETARYELFPVKNPAQSPVYELYFNYQNIAFRELCGLPVTFELIQNDVSNDVFNLQVRDFGASGRFTLDFDLNRRAFAGAAERRRTAGHYGNLLAAFCTDAERALAAVDLLSAAERQELLHGLNPPPSAYGEPRPLHGLIAAQAAVTPDAVAVVCDGRHLSCAALTARAAHLAQRLRALGVGPEVRVGIHLERSLEMVTALLATLFAGGAYVPLDPGYPRERLTFMLDDARPVVLIAPAAAAAALRAATSSHAAAALDPYRELPAATAAAAAAAPPAAAAIAQVDDAHPAYVIYTSGSTGRPKAVVSTHGGIRNRLLWMQQQYALGAADRVLQKTPLSFDVSVWEVFWPLLAGATLCLALPDGHRDAAYLERTVAAERITVLHFVPSMLEGFLAQPDLAACDAVRLVVCSGEELPEAVARRCRERLPGLLENLYGPTEAAVDVTCWSCPPPPAAAAPPAAPPPIGRPIANIRIHLLDRAGQLAPRGLAGELHIGGIGLARGYLGRPELTAERFIPDGTGAAGGPGARLYRTGDLARYLPSGDIEFLGRIDGQVKLRGFRIELGEIEATLGRHPAVRQAAVALREDRPGDRRLVAYLVLHAAAAGSPPTTAEMRALLATTLPDHMLPAAVATLAALPLSPSGKLDRAALPPPAAEASTAARVAPRSPLEGLLASVWAEVLGREGIGVHDSFFDLGGNSLSATQVSVLVQEMLPVELPLRRMFESPTIDALARLIEESAAGLPADARAAMAEVLADYAALAGDAAAAAGAAVHQDGSSNHDQRA